MTDKKEAIRNIDQIIHAWSVGKISDEVCIELIKGELVQFQED